MEKRTPREVTEKQYLEHYNPGNYPRPSVAVDMVIFTIAESKEENYRRLPVQELQVLLIRRGNHPFLGSWALPGGFVKPGETVGKAAQRKLKEETGIGNIYLEQLYTFSDPNRDPRTWVMSCAHMALANISRLKPVSEAAAWFSLSREKESGRNNQSGISLSGQGHSLSAVLTHTGDSPGIIKNDGLAFDHAAIIDYALTRLRNKLEYTDIAFNLLPPLFSLTQLQQVYEVILGRPLLKAAFRRKIAPLVEESDEYIQNAGHRPSRLFRKAGGTE